MRDFINIGPGPADEECVQVSRTEPYEAAMKAECRRFLELIRKHVGEEPEGARLAIKSFPHDFGPYSEVVCHFDDEQPASVQYALMCESSAPTTWDQPLPPKPLFNLEAALEEAKKMEAEYKE